MIVCTRCGFQNEDSDTFCGSCAGFLEWSGEKVARGGPRGRHPSRAPTPEPEEEPDRAGFIDRVKDRMGIGDARPGEAPGRAAGRPATVGDHDPGGGGPVSSGPASDEAQPRPPARSGGAGFGRGSRRPVAPPADPDAVRQPRWPRDHRLRRPRWRRQWRRLRLRLRLRLLRRPQPQSGTVGGQRPRRWPPPVAAARRPGPRPRRHRHPPRPSDAAGPQPARRSRGPSTGCRRCQPGATQPGAVQPEAVKPTAVKARPAAAAEGRRRLGSSTRATWSAGSAARATIPTASSAGDAAPRCSGRRCSPCPGTSAGGGG